MKSASWLLWAIAVAVMFFGDELGMQVSKDTRFIVAIVCAVGAMVVGRLPERYLGGGKLDDDKKQVEEKGKRLEAKSEKDTNTISNESIPLKEEDVLKAQVQFERDRLDYISGKEIYIYRNFMSKWFNDLNAKYRYDDSMSKKIRTDWYDYMRSLKSKGDDARKRFMAIEDGFAVAIGEEAIKQLQEVRSRDDNAFDDSGMMAPIGYYYDYGGKLVPIGYSYVGGELLSDDGQFEWRQANAYERLQKLRDFVERNGGFMYDTKWPSQVQFALPYAILKELFEANTKILVALDDDGAITEQAGVPGHPHVLRVYRTGEPIEIPSSAASTCQGAEIDLVSISDDELELITRHRTSAS